MTLVAFVDGELEPQEALAVEKALLRDPQAQERVRALRQSASLLRSAFGELAVMPVPEHLRAVVLETPQPGPFAWLRPIHTGRSLSRPGATHGPQPSGRPISRFAAGGSPAWMRIAATVTLLAIGASAGWLAAGISGSRTQTAAADPALTAARGALVQATLESTKSGSSNVWRDPNGQATLVVAPVRTFRDEDARFCREFRETVTQGGVQTLLRHGVACRNPAGRWDTRFYVVPGADPPAALISG